MKLERKLWNRKWSCSRSEEQFDLPFQWKLKENSLIGRISHKVMHIELSTVKSLFSFSIHVSSLYTRKYVVEEKLK